MASEIKLFLFDLDGTLIDSKRDIANSVHHTMKMLGLPAIDDDVIYSFVGNGVTPLIQKSVEVSGGHSFEKALEIFKAHYDQHLLDTTKLFDGVEEVLEYFHKIPKVVITNKSQGYSEKILKGLGVMKYFEGVYGGDTSFPKKPNPALVHHLLKEFGVSPKETAIIGDGRVDIETGKNAGILTCGVTYGFRPLKEIQESGCDFLIYSPKEILELF